EVIVIASFVFSIHSFYIFFFQAEDGIRDATVTGVQTCALPISNFVLAECGPRARSIRAGLAARGVLVRDFSDRPGLDTALRITLPGDPADFERLRAALEGTLDAEGLEP